MAKSGFTAFAANCASKLGVFRVFKVDFLKCLALPSVLMLRIRFAAITHARMPASKPAGLFFRAISGDANGTAQGGSCQALGMVRKGSRGNPKRNPEHEEEDRAGVSGWAVRGPGGALNGDQV